MESAQRIGERQEFWKPPMESASEFQRPVAARMESCPECAADLVIGSRFCHVCGTPRYQPEVKGAGFALPAWLSVARLREAIGLPMSAMVALFAGFVCLAMAVLTGLMYTATTILDWQAVQVWRIEWLLAAVAAFVAGILLKERKA